MRRLAALAVLLATLVACSSEPSGDGTTERARTTEPMLESVYGVEASGCSLVPRFGSGALIETGLVATAAHTVAGATGIVVHDRSGAVLPATLVAFDADLDLAVLAIDQDSAGPPLPVGDARAGDAGWLLSWSPTEGAQAKPITVTRRIRVTIEDIYIEDLVERRVIEVDGNVVSGDSGGAVVGTDGTILGVVYGASRDKGFGFAVRIEEVAGLLEDLAPVTTSRCVP